MIITTNVSSLYLKKMKMNEKITKSKLCRPRYEVLFSKELQGGCGGRQFDATADGVNNCSVEHTCHGKKIKRNAV